MKILITGSTGFLGSHLTKALIDEGHEVVLLKRSFSNTWRLADVLDKVTVYDIDKIPLDQPFKQSGPFDAILHTATKYDRNGELCTELLDSNVSFPLQLLENAMKYRTKLFINTDTFIYKQNQSYKHLVGYALTKQQFAQWLKLMSEKEKIRVINLKLEHMYGPLDNPNKFVPFILQSCLQNIAELNLTLGDQRRDFIHIQDVVSAYSLILKQPLEDFGFFQEYEVGTGESVAVRKFVELVHQKTNSSTLVRFGALPHRKNEMMDSKANNEELKKLGWASQINLYKGIELTIAEERAWPHKQTNA